MRALIIPALLLLFTVPVLANGYDVYAPPLAWSPDGKHLAVVVSDSWPYGDVLVPGELRMYDRYGRCKQVLAAGKASSPSFSHLGSLVAVSNGDLMCYDEMRLDSGEEYWVARQLTLRGDLLDCSWSPRSIYFTSGERFYGCDVCSTDLDNNDLHVIDSGPDGSAFAPTVSPGGRYLCYLLQPGYEGNWAYERLMVMDLESGETRRAAKSQLRKWGYHESNAVFLDDHTVIFQRGGWGDWNLIRLDLETGREYIELADAQHPSISANGRWLAFTRRDREEKQVAEYDWDVAPAVWLFDRKTWKLSRASPPGVAASFPAISPDGRRMAWLEEDGGAVKVVVRARANLR